MLVWKVPWLFNHRWLLASLCSPDARMESSLAFQSQMAACFSLFPRCSYGKFLGFSITDGCLLIFVPQMLVWKVPWLSNHRRMLASLCSSDANMESSLAFQITDGCLLLFVLQMLVWKVPWLSNHRRLLASLCSPDASMESSLAF